MIGSMAAFGIGAGMMAYALNSKKTKKKATKMINNAMDIANNKLNAMK